MRLIGAWLNWLMGLWPGGPKRRPLAMDRLLELRSVCYTTLDDLHTPLAKGLLVRVDTAQSADAFWHMRPRLFDAVSEVHGEVVATQRLVQLDTVLRVNHDRRSSLARGADGKGGQAPSQRRRRASD